jgi:hypothetical protein
MADTLSSGKSQTSNNISPNVVFPQLQPSYGVVFEVITDIGSDSAKSKGLGSAIPIGGIRFRLLSDKNVNVNTNEQLSIAYPLNKNIVSLPTKNETVVIHNLGGVYHYSRMGGDLTPNVNTRENLISTTFVSDGVDFGDSKGKASDYQKVSDTGITRKQKSSNNSDYDGYGEYFTSDNTIHKLKLYEGDTLLESRFGQSIRLSGYNNPDRELYPTLIIRNGENTDSKENEVGTTTEEDINKDGSIIALSSGERLLDYILPIENKKESFFNYPNELRGNQILLNSDRIILSAKNAEMIGVAKKDIGFITDGQFSIDAIQGINITTEAGIFVDTKNRDINMNIGNGVVALGTDGELEPAVKGETLVEILSEFMTIVAQQIFVTPAGATSPGPTNNPKINALHSKLNSMLSNHVQLK